jgi:hypothetical protein
MDCPDLCLEAFWLQELEWVMEDSHKRSCWKNSIGVSVPVPYRSDVYVCSKSCWLCLTAVYWLLECNKVPSWIEPEYVTISSFKDRNLLDRSHFPAVTETVSLEHQCILWRNITTKNVFLLIYSNLSPKGLLLSRILSYSTLFITWYLLLTQHFIYQTNYILQKHCCSFQTTAFFHFSGYLGSTYINIYIYIYWCYM